MKAQRFPILAVAILCSSPVLAHPGIGSTIAFTSGFAHPIHGLDHVLAITAVGMWAYLRGRWAVLGLPLTFLSMMLMGGTLALIGFEVPAAEIGIAASVLVLGAAIAFGLRLPNCGAALACGFFGLVHGYAHGIEIGEGASTAQYVGGFLIATTLILVGGITCGAILVRCAPVLSRLLGAGVALAGAALFLR